MKTLSILSVILLLSCSSSKNMEEQGNLQNRKNKYQTVKGQISVHYKYYFSEYKETDIFFPANIAIYAKKDSIAETKSDNKGVFTFKLKRKYLDRKLHAVITPKKDRVAKRIITHANGGYKDAVAIFKKNGVFIKDTIPFQITKSDTSHLQWHFKNCEVNETGKRVSH